MPPGYVLDLLPVEVLGFVAVVAAAIWIGGRVRKGLAALKPWLVWLREFREDWSGVPARPGHARKPGIPERMSALEDAVPGMAVGFREVKKVQAEHTEQLAANAEALVTNATAVAESKAAVAEVAEALADVRHNVKPNSGTSSHDALIKEFRELRKLVAEVMQELASLRGDYDKALAHTHPDYLTHDPDDFSD